VLAANPTARVLACDCAPEAVACAARRVAAAEDAPGSFASRFAAFPCDPCVDDLAASIARAAESAGWWRSSSAPSGSGGVVFPVDAAMMIFVLSAVPPGAATARFLRAVRDALRPGARVFFRDYARYDLPMLRFRAGLLESAPGGASRSREEESTFARGDGTLATFRSKEEVVEMFKNAGFEKVEGSEAVRYCCVRNTNRKKGVEMRRVFIHGEFVAA
jgi:methyltransferase-like protein 6